MILGVFDVHDQIAFGAVVFARNRNHALALANVWISVEKGPR